MINNEVIEKFNHLPEKLIATVHKDPDYDAIGSLLALGNLINKMGKEICLYAPDIDINQFENLPGINTIETKIEKEYDLAIFLGAPTKIEFINLKNSLNINKALILIIIKIILTLEHTILYYQYLRLVKLYTTYINH